MEGDREEVRRNKDSQEEGERIESADNGRAAEVGTVAAREGEDSTGRLGHDVCDEGHECPEKCLP